MTKKSLLMTCYCFDSVLGATTLGALLRRGVKISVIMDGKNMNTPSCSKQLSTISELMNSMVDDGGKIELRMYSPKSGSAFSAMHVKSWCLDGLVYIGGSYNFTHNAEVSNEEHLVVVKDPGTIETYQEWFFGLWNKATEISKEDAARRCAQYVAKRSASRSRARVPVGGDD